MSGHPLHTASCTSWTYPWACPTCSTPVYVYECTCGCWVMFDELGEGWPQHSCFHHEYRRLRERVLPILKAGADPKSATFQPFAELKKLLDPVGAHPPSEGRDPSRDGKSIDPRTAPTTKEHVIKRMDPMPDEKITFIGVIRERHSGTARIKELYATLGTIGRKMLNLPSERNAVQLTIVDTEGEPQESYSGIADGSRLERGLTEGVMVWVEMVGKVYPSASAWVITDVHGI